MSNFSPSDAALEGFRLTGRHPVAVLAWCGVYFLGIAAIALVMAAVLGPTFIEFIRSGEVEADAAEVFAGELVRSWPAIVVVVLLALFFISVITAALYRYIFDEAESRRFGLRVGADEVRIAVVHAPLSFLFLCLFVAFGNLLAGLVALEMAWVAGSLAVLLVAGYLFVRLALALPATFAEKRVALARGWQLSRGRFWPLFGMWALAIVFYLMIWVVVAVLNVAIVAGATLAQSSASGVALAVTIGAVAVVSIFLQLLNPVLQIIITLAPVAVAYRELNGPQAEAPAAPPAAAEPATP